MTTMRCPVCSVDFGSQKTITAIEGLLFCNDCVKAKYSEQDIMDLSEEVVPADIGIKPASLADLFEKVDAVRNTTKVKKKPTVIVNAEEHPAHIVNQIRAMTAGTPQRITRAGNRYFAHSVFK